MGNKSIDVLAGDDADVVMINKDTISIFRLKQVILDVFGDSRRADLCQKLKEQGIYTDRNSPGMLGNGQTCQVLTTKSGKWRQGKLKIRTIVEFYPDEPEQPESTL